MEMLVEPPHWEEGPQVSSYPRQKHAISNLFFEIQARTNGENLFIMPIYLTDEIRRKNVLNQCNYFYLKSV